MMVDEKLISGQRVVEDTDERVLNRIRQARLPNGKYLGNFDVTQQKSVAREHLELLADPEWLDLHKNILILGPSAAGKTHLAAALGREWCWGRPVLFSKAAQLIEKLNHARPSVQVGLKRLDRYDALIVDDLSSWIARSQQATNLLITLLQHRLNRRSLVVTTNLCSFQWNAISLDQNSAWLLEEQLVNNSVVIQLENCCMYPRIPSKKH
jgi:DNA replication protein DnaC